jgi:hypothetical protein
MGQILDHTVTPFDIMQPSLLCYSIFDAVKTYVQQFSLFVSCFLCCIVQVTATVFVIRAMSRNPELSVMPERSEKDKSDAIQEEEDEEEEEDEDEDDDDEDEEGDDEEDDEENEEENDDDIGETAVPAPVQSLPAYTTIKPKKGDKSDTKASSAHTPSSSSSSSVSMGKDSTGRSAIKGKGKSAIDDEHTIEGVEEVEGEGEAVDGCRWVMQRLKGLGSDPRGRKRLHVIRVSTYILIRQSHVILVRHDLLSF